MKTVAELATTVTSPDPAALKEFKMQQAGSGGIGAEGAKKELGVNLKTGGIVCKGQGKARRKTTRMY